MDAFRRDPAGRECDLVFPVAQKLVPVEIKHGTRIRKDDCKGIQAFMAEYGERAPVGCVISMHPDVFRIMENVWNIPLGFLAGRGA
ncbi:MAG: hypothetical protein EOM20_18640 [Spartobacteria bacterium]|nr:hypothetical protein [Spartobacteria bacterium]